MAGKNPVVQNIKTEVLEYDLSNPLFAAKEVREKILSLLPSKRDTRITFELKSASPAVANAFRRVAMVELEVKCLDFDPADLDTNEEYIIPVELRDRINKIPIQQNIADDVEYSIKVANMDSTEEYALVRSRDMQQTAGKKIPLPFYETFRLAQLQPGKYLKIPRIFVSKGYGFNEVRWSVTSDVIYQCTDYILVTSINDRGNFIKKRVNTAELEALMHKLKIKKDPELWRKKILVIPNKSYQKKLLPRDHETIKKFDIVVENPEAWDVTAEIDDKFLKSYSSAEANPQDYYLGFRLYNNVEPLDLMMRICDNIIDRIDGISKSLSEKNETSGITHIIQDDKKTQVKIKGEDHTIGQLLITTLHELDSTATVIKTIEHPHNRVVIITMIHAQPLKWFQDALDLIKKRFMALRASFESHQRREK